MQPDQELPFTINDRVRYIPHHARDEHHRDCQNGRVIRIGKVRGNILVAFDGQVNPQWCHVNSCVPEPVYVASAPLPVIE